MKSFNGRELEIISKLAELDITKPLLVQDFLQHNYFKEDQSRGLIIQTQGDYAVLFLKTEKFDTETEQQEEVKQFVELISLFNYLHISGYITIYRAKTEKMYFIQDGFNATKILNNNIILNSRGDYTSAPDTIHDSGKNIIYKGIVFRSDTYNLILDTTVGSLIVSESLKDLLHAGKGETISGEPNKTNGRNKEKTKGSGINITILILVSLMFLILIIGGAFTYFKIKQYDNHLAGLNSDLQQLEDSMTVVSSEIKEVHKNILAAGKSADGPETLFFGIDISKWNGNEASDISSKDSITFIICKATEGTGFIDPELKNNWELIRSGNYILGAYHFYRVNDDPLKQADHFLSTINLFGKTDIAPIVDIEQESLPKNGKVSAADVQKKLFSFLNTLEEKSGRVPIIYTDLVFANEYLLDTLFGKYPLWLAEYTDAPNPRLPKTWETKGYKLWQKSDRYFIDTRTTDYDVFQGPISELTK